MLFRNQIPACQGYIDSADDRRILGWVWDRRNPRRRLDVHIYAAGCFLGAVRADSFRADLVGENIGDGHYGFSFELPPGEFPDETVAAKVAGHDYWLLDGSGRAGADQPRDGFLNSARRGWPLLRPALSQRQADETDIEIAAALQRQWHAAGGAAAASKFAGPKSMWGRIVATRHRSLADLLDRPDAGSLAAYLVSLQRLPELDGITQGEAAYRDFIAASDGGRRAAVAPFHDMLASLAQYLGLERAECDEQDFVGATLALDQAELAAKIEAALGHGIAPPTVFDGLYGLALGDRVLHGRDIQALYAALRAIEAADTPTPVICEVGGGFGQVAHYAWLRGVRRYTIVDLPTVCAMQYYYLRKTLPGVRVTFREPSEPPDASDGIDLVFASRVHEGLRMRGDIVLNCDSFPEMGEAICAQYFALLPDWAPLLLSVNQEANRPGYSRRDRQIVVGELLPKYGFARRYRFRSWIRPGYVEELWQSRANGRLGTIGAG